MCQCLITNRAYFQIRKYSLQNSDVSGACGRGIHHTAHTCNHGRPQGGGGGGCGKKGHFPHQEIKKNMRAPKNNLTHKK